MTPAKNDAAVNAEVLEAELKWLDKVLQARISLHFGQASEVNDIQEILPPELDSHSSPYARTVENLALGFNERLVIILALAPHVRPHALDIFFVRNNFLDKSCAEFGGSSDTLSGGFSPTWETAAFLIAGENLAKRFDCLALFRGDHILRKENILQANNSGADEPLLRSDLRLSLEYAHLLTFGQHQEPVSGVAFPAIRLTTQLGWDDLVLAPKVLDEVKSICTWITHQEVVLSNWGLEKRLKPGFRSLFYGPSGTGKTLTATLIGQATQTDVYRVDLSMLVSKFIGETEKSLANLFDQAASKNWILYFDEADALFGVRTETRSANDRYANQETAYLLHRIENYPGTVLLATNLKSNIDQAFARRFQSLIHFAIPNQSARRRLWLAALDGGGRQASDVDIEALAENFEISGGTINSAVRNAVIQAVQDSREEISHSDLLRGVRKELTRQNLIN